MSRLRRLVDHPQEVSFFLFLSAFSLVITVIYWFASYEAAGTVLLAGFTLATGGIGVRLGMDPRSALARRRAPAHRERAGEAVEPGDGAADAGERRDAAGRGYAAEGTGGIDRPFLDEEGRLPTESLAPFAVGLGVAVATTGLVFGVAPVILGVLPFAWGAWSWLSGVRAELAATEAERSRASSPAEREVDEIEARRAATVALEDGIPADATPGRTARGR